jgi:hypothetical protein
MESSNLYVDTIDCSAAYQSESGMTGIDDAVSHELANIHTGDYDM